MTLNEKMRREGADRERRRIRRAQAKVLQRLLLLAGEAVDAGGVELDQRVRLVLDEELVEPLRELLDLAGAVQLDERRPHVVAVDGVTLTGVA